MGFFKWIEDMRALWWYISEGQFGELCMEQESVAKPIKDPQDKVSTNIFVGKIIDDGSIKCEVVAHHNSNNMHVKILEIKWDRLGTYLDVGKIYPVFKHSGWGKGLEVWEISGNRMKRSTSQLILQWEEGLGWTWDLDM